MAAILKKGDVIGIAAPASPFSRKKFERGVTALEEMGFRVFYHRHIFSKKNYLAGSDKRRAKELTALFRNKKVRAILYARGGYGSQRIIPLLNPTLLKKNRKPVIGFSDATALLIFLHQKGRVPVFYGPSLTQLGRRNRFTLQHFQAVLSGPRKKRILSIGNCKVLKQGKARGRFAGGCLSLITSSIGTPYELKTDGAILFIEDTGERVYAVDRMLNQLKNGGKLKKVKGIVIGSLKPVRGEPHSMETMLRDILKNFRGPVVMHFPAGHTEKFVTLPLGVPAMLDTKKRRLVL